jgi:predicted nucleotidyltransferase component of viral defense system
MKIPLAKKLKKRMHAEVAMLQDEAVEIFYSICAEHEPVLHGGTAIWRCYNGSRFSEDLDFYAEVGSDFEKKFNEELKSRGLSLLKYKKAPNVIFSKISDGTVEVRLEVSLRKPPEKVLRKYEKADGTYMDVYTLSPEGLMAEKMSAYKGRRFIRDIYDIYHLSGYAEKQVPGIPEFLSKLEKPVDEENLKVLIYSGVAPSFRGIVEALKRRFG